MGSLGPPTIGTFQAVHRDATCPGPDHGDVVLEVDGEAEDREIPLGGRPERNERGRALPVETRPEPHHHPERQQKHLTT